MPKRRGHGEGSVYQRADGRWVASVDLGTVNGKRLRKTFYGRTRKEATIKLQTALAQKQTNSLVTRSSTVEAWLNYWLDVICTEQGLKVNTMKSHRSKVERHLIPALGAHRLDKLETEHIRRLYADMRTRGYKEYSIRQVHAVLKRALRVAVNERRLTHNPADPVRFGAMETRRTGLTVADARKVLTAAGDDPRFFLALYLGMRQGEVLALRWSDVDLDAGVLRVERSLAVKPKGAGFVFETPKTQLSRGVLPMPPVVRSRMAVLYAAHAHAAVCDCLIFSTDGVTPTHPSADGRAWRQLLEQAGVPHVALHAARNTTATLLRSIGVTSQDQRAILRHTSISMTEHYQDDDVERKRLAIDALERALEA